MQVNVVQAIGAVTREVGLRGHEGRPARVVAARREYGTGIDDLWDALTNGERIPRWFLPISGELRLGGRYQLEGNAGGTITQCEPPRTLGVTWEYGGSMSWLTVRLTEAGHDRTELELEHLAYVGDDDMWDQFGPGAAGVGWDLALMGLDLHLATGTANDPAEAARWVASAEGRAFIVASSTGWCQASIAAGTPEPAATAAAERTTVAYTGGA